jgi:hypothetical protein
MNGVAVDCMQLTAHSFTATVESPAQIVLETCCTLIFGPNSAIYRPLAGAGVC